MNNCKVLINTNKLCSIEQIINDSKEFTDPTGFIFSSQIALFSGAVFTTLNTGKIIFSQKNIPPKFGQSIVKPNIALAEPRFTAGFVCNYISLSDGSFFKGILTIYVYI